MKILLLNQFFWPDLAATSQLLTDVARDLAAAGHDVRVVCGTPSYAGVSTSERPPVHIDYLADISFSKHRLARVASYLSFWILCLWKVMVGPRPDVVVTLTTPPLLSLVGTMLKMARGCRHVIWEMDIYPDLAVQLDLLGESSLPTRILRALASFARRRADSVIALGECMRDRLVELGVDHDRIEIAENWADGRVFAPNPHKDPGGRLTIVYPGNLGLGHDVETLLGALEVLRDEENLQFLFVGGGKGLDQVRSECVNRGASICKFWPYEEPRELVSKRFSCAHIGLVTQKSSCSGFLVPSKIYPLMGAGLPFIFIGPSEATPKRLIDRLGCGWHICNGDVEGFVRILRILAANRDMLRAAGQRARQAFRLNYDMPLGVGRVSRVVCRADAVSSERSHLSAIDLHTENRAAK